MRHHLRRIALIFSVLAAFSTVQPALADGFGEVGHFHYTNNTYQYLIYGGDLYQSYDAPGAYTNNQDTGTPFQGRAAYVHINYSGGIAKALQIDSPVASSAFPPGGYDYLTSEVLTGAGANAQWVQSVLRTHRVTVTDTTNAMTVPGTWYALSDVSALSGYTSTHGSPTDLGPWPQSTYGLPPNTVESGSDAYRGNVDLSPVPMPSVQITSVEDLTTGKPASDGVNPGDTLRVTNTVGADDAYSGWGAGALLAWFGWGNSSGTTTYVNAFYGASDVVSVPMFGFGPAAYQQSYTGGQVQGQPQPGISPQSAYTLTVPSNVPAGATMNLYVYSVDGIDRYAQAITTVPVRQAPTLSLSITPTGTQATGQSFTVDAQTTNAQGGTVTFSQSGHLANNAGAGTLSGDDQSDQVRITYPAQSGSTYSYSPTATSSQAGTESITATLTMPDGSSLTKVVSASWAQTPTITVSATPTSLYDGHASTITATASHLQSDEEIVVTQSTDTTSPTMAWSDPDSGDTWSSASQVHGAAGESSLTPAATFTGSHLQTITYTATLVHTDTGQAVSGAVASVNITWTPPTQPTLSLSASNFAPTTGQVVVLSATASHLQSQYGIYIHDLTADTLSGSNVGGGSPGVNPESVSAVSNTTRSIQYVAKMDWLNPATGQTQIIASNTITVTWGGTPGLTLSVSSTAPTVGTAVTLTATGTSLPSSYTLAISDNGSADALGGSSEASANDTNPFSTTAVSSSAISNEPFQAEVYNASGQLVTSNIVYVTWSAPAGPPALSLRADSPTEPVGTPDTLTASGTNLTTGSVIQIVQDNTDGGDTFGSIGQTNSSGTYFASSPNNPFAPQVNDVSGVNGYQATYSAVAYNRSGQVEATSSNVGVLWGSAATPSLSISPNPSQLPINQSSILTVSGQNIPVGDDVLVYLTNTPSGTIGNWWTQGAVAVWDQTGFNGTFAQTVSVAQSTPGTYSYIAVVENPALGSPPNNFVTGGTTSVYWYPPGPSVSLSPDSQTLPVGQGTTFQAQLGYIAPGQSVYFFGTNGMSFGQYWNNTTTYFTGTQSFYVSSPAGPTTYGIYASFTPSTTATPSSNYISITWQNQPSATLTADPTTAIVGTYTPILVYPHDIPSGWPYDSAGVLDENTGQVFYTDPSRTNYGVTSYLMSSPGTQTFVPIVHDAYGNIVYRGTPVTVTWVIPTLTISSPSSSYEVGQPAALTGTVTQNMPSGSNITLVDLGNQYTFSYEAYYDYDYPENATTGAQNQNPYTADATMTTVGSDEYQAQLGVLEWVNGNYTMVYYKSSPLTITWGNSPSITLAAGQTTLTPGQSTTLTATAQYVPAGFTIEIHDLSDASTLSGVNSQTGPVNPFATRAYSAIPQTVTYDAQLLSASSQVVATSNEETVTWTNPVSVSLVASPTSLFVGQSSTITADVTGLPSGATVQIVDLHHADTLGGTDAQNSGSTPFSTTATSLAAQTVQYQAQVYEGGHLLAQSNPVAVLWQPLALSLSASPTTLYADQQAAVTAWSNALPAGDSLQIHDLSQAHTFYGYNDYTQSTSPATGYVYSTQAQTVTYQAQILNAQGAVLATSNTATVTWQVPPYGFLSYQVLHTPGWLANLNTWTSNPANPPRSIGDFWAGENLIVQAQAYQVVPIASIEVTLSDLSYYVVAPDTAPSDEMAYLSYNATTGLWSGEIADPANLQYLQNGTYPITFTVTYRDGTVRLAQTTLTILGQWAGNGPNDYYHLSEALN